MDDKVIRYSLRNQCAFSHNRTFGWNFDSHVHTCYEFIYIIEGNFLYTIEGNEYTISSGDIIMTSPYELHSFSFPEKGIYERQFLHIYPVFMKNFPDLFSEINSQKLGTYNYIPATIVNKYGLNNFFQNIEEYSKEPTKNTDTMVLTYSIQLILKISEILNSENILSPHIELNKTTVEIKSYVDKNFTTPINLDEIANNLFLNKSYLCRNFKQNTGMTIKNYINMKRITYAKNKILSGEKSSNIYLECGFNDYSTFYRAFSKYVSMTPDEFKRYTINKS